MSTDLFSGTAWNAADAATWAVDHLGERQSVFGRADLLAAMLAREPGAVTVDAAERAIADLEDKGVLHAATGLDYGKHWATDAAIARESETVALMRGGQGVDAGEEARLFAGVPVRGAVFGRRLFADAVGPVTRA